MSTNFVISQPTSTPASLRAALTGLIETVHGRFSDPEPPNRKIEISAAADPNAGHQNCKRRGEISELIFAVAIMKHGMVATRPHGDSDPFDSVVLPRKWKKRHFKVTRVQIRSLHSGRLNQGLLFYQIPIRPKDRLRIRARDYDVLAVYIAPHDAWYIFPAQVLRGRKILNFYPHRRPKCGGWAEQFRDRWDLFQ